MASLFLLHRYLALPYSDTQMEKEVGRLSSYDKNQNPYKGHNIHFELFVDSFGHCHTLSLPCWSGKNLALICEVQRIAFAKFVLGWAKVILGAYLVFESVLSLVSSIAFRNSPQNQGKHMDQG